MRVMETSRQSVAAVEVAGFDEAVAHGAGAYYFVENAEGPYIGIIIPSEHTPRELPLTQPESPRGWHWDGQNLTPSIMAWGFTHSGERYEIWHGWLRAGRMESV